MPTRAPERVGIVGLGLMGGSVARALKAQANPPRITAFTRDQGDSRKALEEGILDRVAATPEEAAREQDVVVYAAPMRVTIELMAEHYSVWGEASITDVVGLKKPLLEEARRSGFGDRYVGAHPMVGGTGSGYMASTEGLFNERTVWLVPGDADPSCVDIVDGIWTSVGARTRRTSAEDHDRLMVWASHLPQLVATALARVLADQGLTSSDLGSGGRDMTRLAMSSSEMWSDLFESSADMDARALEALENELATMRARLANGNVAGVAEMMDRIADWRTDT